MEIRLRARSAHSASTDNSVRAATIRSLGKRAFAVGLALCAAAASIVAQTAPTTVHTFTGANGSNPYAGLLQASDGHFYGVTHAGGSAGFGTVFRLELSGTFTTIHHFTNADGSNPAGRLVQGTDGRLYGTTIHGGSAGFGTVFAIDFAGALTTLHAFLGTDGANPGAGLIQATDGNFYGTTTNGGSADSGTLFRITAAGALTTLHHFTGPDGSLPVSGVMQAADGNFYGTTYVGGASGAGTLFRVASGTLTTLHHFDFDDGAFPVARLLQAADGNYYGTTTEFGPNGSGTVFKLDGAGVLSTLHGFNGADGGYPEAGLVQTTDGSLYGSTYEGGEHFLGTIFKIDTAGVLTTLHEFAGADGSHPYAALLKANGNYLYGTALDGGSSNLGIVFRLQIGAGAALVPAAATGVYGGTTTLSATLTFGGDPVAGKSIAFSLNGAPVGSALTNGSGVATLSGASVAGLGAGAHPDAVFASFAGAGDVPAASGTAGIQISQATPAITWSNPSDIFYGTPLGAAQLNASASVAGSLVYTPASGAVLAPGDRTLSVAFTPTDSTNYTPAEAQVVLHVNNRQPVLTNPGPQTNAAGSLTYAEIVLNDGPAAYWRLGETSGTTAGDSAGASAATVNGGVTLGQPSALGDGNQAMQFNGTTGYLRANNSLALQLAGDLTIELWLNTAMTARQTLVSKNYLSEFELTLEPWGGLNFYQGTGTSYEEIPLSFAGLTANTWQHLVLTRTAATKTVRVYVNGVLKGSRTYTGTVAVGTRPVSIGRSDGGSKYVNGRLDDVALYPTVLSGTQVAAHYAARSSVGDTAVSLQLAASDPDGNALTFAATGLPPALSVNALTGLVSGSLTPASAGSHTVNASASDGYLAHGQSFTWTVTAVNRAPVLVNPGHLNSDENTTVSLQLSAADPNGDPLTYTVTGLPPSLAMNATGLISGTLPYSSAGAYLVRATVSDGTLTNSQTFVWTVIDTNRAPVLANPGAQSHWAVTGYPSAILTDGPIGYWRLGEIAGTTAGDSTGVNAGTLAGGVTLGQPGALADGNAAMLFNGSTGYVSVANPAASLSGDLTIELWLNTAMTARQTLVSKNYLSEFELTLEPWGGMNFYQGNGTAYEEISLSFAGITANTWHHVVLTRTAATKTIRLYVNGAFKGNKTYTGSVAAGTRPVTIGRSDGGSKYVNGRLDDVALYSTVLNGSQVAAHYGLRTSPGVPTAVVLQLSATDADGDTLTYGASGLPAGLTVNTSTGQVSGTLSPESAGIHAVTVTASDGRVTASQTFTWTILTTNRAPVLADPGPQSTWVLTGYAPAVLADGPAAYWRFGETSGTVAADAAGANPGTLVGGVTPGQTGALADGNTAMLFNGSTGYVQVPNPAASLASDLTIELWLNVSLAARQTLISKNSKSEFELTLETWGQLNFYQGNGTTYEEIPLPFAGITANAWQHVVLTRVASTKTIRLYVNGVLKGTRTYTGTVVAGTRPISIGRSDAGSKYVNGRLDEVAVYPTALAATRVASHYAQRLANGSATTVSLQLSAVDPDGDAMVYSATGLPASLSINPNTGLISGTVPGTSVGTHTVTVVASDGALSHSRTFTWTVQQ